MNHPHPDDRARGGRVTTLVTGLLVAVVVSLLVSVVTDVLPAYAVPPANDDIADAARITDLPFAAEADTREATARRSDGECVGNGSIWYRFRPTTTQRLRASTIGSDYDTLLAVFQGRRSDRRLLACNDDAADLASTLRLRFEEGRRYWIAVSTCCSRRSSIPSGQAVFSLYSPTLLEMSLSVDEVESGAVSGRLLVSGTATCTTPSLVSMVVRASQRNGDVVARGAERVEVNGCTGEGAPWQARIDTRTGWAFRPGTVFIDVEAFAFDGFDQDELVLDTTATVADNPTARP